MTARPTSDETSPDEETHHVPPDTDLRGVFPRDGAWGHRIAFDNFDTRRVYGWLTPVANDGDLFGYEMVSGEIAVFRLTDVRNQADPADMFFARAEDVGYLEHP